MFSGNTRREDMARYAYQPDKVVDSIADLHHAELAAEFAGAGRGGGPRPALASA